MDEVQRQEFVAQMGSEIEALRVQDQCDLNLLRQKAVKADNLEKKLFLAKEGLRKIYGIGCGPDSHIAEQILKEVESDEKGTEDNDQQGGRTESFTSTGYSF